MSKIIDSVILTDHAKKRFKERLNIPKKSFERTALKAYNNGIGFYKAKGKLKEYLTYLYTKYDNPNNDWILIKIYGEYIYIFKENILITMYSIPNELKKNLKL